MNRLQVSLLSMVILFGTFGPGFAHSLKDVETALHDKELYFQKVDIAAPDFELQTAAGTPVSLETLRGKVVVLNFIYTSCPDSCPLHSEKLAQIQSMINLTPMRRQVEFVTITTDPKNDTKEIMRGYGALHGLDPDNWTFLRPPDGASDDTTRKIALAYGPKFDATDDNLQMHGVVTHVIDQDGRLRARFHGLDFEPVNLVMFVNALVNKAQKPHPHASNSLWQRMRDFF